MDDHSADMTKKTAKNVVKTIFQSPSPVIKIEFQGGDPSTDFDMVKYILSLIHIWTCFFSFIGSADWDKDLPHR